MAQSQTNLTTRTTNAPDNTLKAAEVNLLNSAINSNATDTETRLGTITTDQGTLDTRTSTLEGNAVAVLSYTTVNLPVTVPNEGTVAFDTTLQTMVYFKGTAWYKVSDDTFVVDNGGGGSPWTPAELGTAYWWDPTDAASITESSNLVSNYVDQNQSAAFSQGNATNQPSTNTRTINALNVLDFGGNDKMQGPLTALDEYTKFTVVAIDTSGQNNTLSHVSGDFDALWESFSTKPQVYQGASNIITGTTDFPIGKTMLLCNTKNSADLAELFVFGNSEGSATGAIGTGTTPLEIGSFLGSNYLDGVLGDIILLPSVASVSDRQKVEGFLAHKWGFTADLDAGHPYKSSAPTL